MKANEAPEKLYLHPTAKGKVGKSWLTFPLTNEDVEYARTDTFIEKACEWLSKHAKKYYFNKDGHYLGTDELIEDFKLSMELWKQTK